MRSPALSTSSRLLVRSYRQACFCRLLARCTRPFATTPPTKPKQLLQLLTKPGGGIVREELCPDARRPWSDPQIYSHAAFVPGIVIASAVERPLPELAALQGLVLVLSLLYHRNYERAGLLAQGEGASAKALFLYGSVQTIHSPTEALLLCNSACFALTLGTFVATNFDRSLYERHHPFGLHVVPGVWSTLVASNNASLLPPEVLAFVLAGPGG